MASASFGRSPATSRVPMKSGETSSEPTCRASAREPDDRWVIQWVPRVGRDHRQAYEEQARKDGLSQFSFRREVRLGVSCPPHTVRSISLFTTGTARRPCFPTSV